MCFVGAGCLKNAQFNPSNCTCVRKLGKVLVILIGASPWAAPLTNRACGDRAVEANVSAELPQLLIAST